MSSLVKALLDGALCNFNDLPGTSLTAAPQRELGRPTPLRPVAGDETRIARPSAPAKKMSVSQGQDALCTIGGAGLAGSAVDLLEAFFFEVLTLSMAVEDHRQRQNFGSPCLHEVDGSACGGEGRRGSGRQGLARVEDREIVHFASCPCNLRVWLRGTCMEILSHCRDRRLD
jgi:hypothetical protein